MELQFYTSINGQKNQMAFTGVNNVISPCYRGAIAKGTLIFTPQRAWCPFWWQRSQASTTGGSRCWRILWSRKIHKKNSGKYTPEDERLEPKNHPIEKENHLPTPSFSGSMLIFQGVLLKKSWKTTWDVTNFCKEWAFLQKQLVSRILSINRIAGN